MLNHNMYYQNLTDATYHGKIQDYLSTVARIAQIVDHSNWQSWLLFRHLAVIVTYENFCMTGTAVRCAYV